MKNLYIIGAGGFGREVLFLARQIESAQSYWRIKGFLNSAEYMDALDGIDTDGYIICESIEEHKITSDNVYVFAIADVDAKRKLLPLFLDKDAEFVDLIHPTVNIGYTTKLGTGVIIATNSFITENVIIGDFVTINAYVSIGHDVIIKDYCTINSFCNITGHSVLEEGVFMGSSAVIVPKVHVGENARIGAGSVVLKNVKSGITVFGNPAKKIY